MTQSIYGYFQKAEACGGMPSTINYQLPDKNDEKMTMSKDKYKNGQNTERQELFKHHQGNILCYIRTCDILG